jgi:hypothetical protein
MVGARDVVAQDLAQCGHAVGGELIAVRVRGHVPQCGE